MKLSVKNLILWVGLGLSTWVGCSQSASPPMTEQAAAQAWGEMTLYLSQYTPANSPTYASRAIGYIGLTMYESVVLGYPEYQSMAGQLNGLKDLPQVEENQPYDWVLSMNAAQAAIHAIIYQQTSDSNKLKLDSLEQAIYENFAGRYDDPEVAERSVAFGKAVAAQIAIWSETDGGHRAYLRNFPKEFEHPTFPGSWQPPLYAQSFSHNPLHPTWGENRTFLTENAELPLPEFIPYDTTVGSPYYEEFKAVYDKERSLTQQEKEIALWWGDDPSDTFTPPGHSYYLATIALKKTRPPLINWAETYARTGMAVADAFIKCWKWKYHFFSERPNTFNPRFIDQSWESFWPDPPFPAFPSGHAIQAAASATVLTDLFGESFSFIDSAHVGRERDELRDTDFVERPFESFWDFAIETADSRFYGGIHTPQDNVVGLEEGKKIAERVNQLNWRKP
ncbi:MAG: vanadium-dependent haloperoxidase [Bacteroidota bacterium]